MPWPRSITSAIGRAVAFVGTRAQRDDPAVLHRVERVEEQRHEDLHHLLFVGEHGADARIRLDADDDAPEARMVLHEAQRLLDDHVEVDVDLGRGLGPAEVEQAVDDALAAMHLLLDQQERVLELRAVRRKVQACLR